MPGLTFSKRVDKSSPQLSELYITGKQAGEVTLACSKSTGGKSPEDLLTLKLKEAYVSSFQSRGSAREDGRRESVSFTCGDIHHDYKSQDKAGVLTSSGGFGLDVISGSSG